jgi:hypothetical protein
MTIRIANKKDGGSRVTARRRIRTAVLLVLLVVIICIHNLSFKVCWFVPRDLFFFSALTNASLFPFVVVYLQKDDYMYEVHTETTKNLKIQEMRIRRYS